MGLRRLLAASPLAVVVAVAAHVAGFGSSHALGGALGVDIARLALIWLGLVAAGGLLWAAAWARPASLPTLASRLLAPLPGGGRFTALAATIAVGGTAVFTALEALEGHPGLPTLASLLALAVAALMLSALVQLAARAIAGLGLTLATLADACVNLAAPVRVIPARARIARPNPAALLRRGRAPPR